MDIEQMLRARGLSAELLEQADCYYLSDDGDSIIAEYPKTWKHSKLPGAPKSREIGPSSMRDGRALIVRW